MQHENQNPINLNHRHPDALTPSAPELEWILCRLQSILISTVGRGWICISRGDPSQLSSQTKWLGCRSFSSGNRISLWSGTATLPGWAHLRYIHLFFHISTSNILQTFILFISLLSLHVLTIHIIQTSLYQLLSSDFWSSLVCSKGGFQLNPKENGEFCHPFNGNHLMAPLFSGAGMSRNIFFWGLHALQTVTTSKVKKLFPSHCSVKRHRRFNRGPRTSAPKSAKTQAAKGQGPIPHVTSIFWSIKTPKGWISTCWLEPWDRDTSKDTQNIKNINNLGLGITNKTNCTFQSFWLAFQFQNFHPGQRHVPRFCHEKQRSSTQVWCNAKRVKKKDLSLDHE